MWRERARENSWPTRKEKRQDEEDKIEVPHAWPKKGHADGHLSGR